MSKAHTIATENRTNPVGWVSPPGRNPTNSDAMRGDVGSADAAVGLRDKAANPTYGAEWYETTLGKFAPFAYGKSLPERDRVVGQYPVLSSAGFTGWHNTPLVKTSGIVIGRKGTVGSVTLSKSAFWVIDTAFFIEDKPERRDLYFTYYLLKTLGLPSMNSDSAVPGLNRDNAHSLSIRVPSLEIQRGIASILRVLDDRIALLRETNATLEAIAQAMFKSWFVDFDPVHAKQQGRAPEGMDEATAALFPDGFEESELGLVPKGWKVKSLDEIAEYLNGLALQKFPPDGDEWLPVIKIAQLRKGDTAGADRANRKMKQEYIIQNGDILFSWSGSLEVEVWCGGEGALNQHLFKVSSDTHPKWFYYLWTKYHLESFRQTAASKATTMGHIQRCHLSKAKVVEPPKQFISAADEYFAPLLECWISNALQAQTLATLRDTTLPRLISGQLRLPEAEALVDEVTA